MRRVITTWGIAALLILGLSINVDASEVCGPNNVTAEGVHCAANDQIAEVLVLSQVEQTCNDIFGTNQTAGVSGEWGSITFDDTSATLGVEVLEGWEVRICVKAGSAQQGDGPEDQGWLGEGVYSLTHSSGKELSHFSFDVREVPPDDDEPTTTTTTLPTTTTTLPVTTTTGETTTTAPLTTTTLPEGPTTTAPGGPTTTGPVGPTSLATTPSGEETLPFTGVEDLGPIALALSTLGTLVLLGVRTLRRDDD